METDPSMNDTCATVIIVMMCHDMISTHESHLQWDIAWGLISDISLK